ncbi:hypothetical protein [Marinobacter sp. NFXS9]|uniref:hypothetical protein n=1 Tax=Marinobacter sp. NFXS9 TaxID=2818433 RepID=UPI0032DF3956
MAVRLPNDVAAANGDAGRKQSLETLYQRSAWSAVTPAEKAGGDDEPEKQSAPEGLDRFRLLGILQVSGGKPEALIRDLNAADDQSPVFRAMPGDELQGTGVILASIDQQQISLEQGGDARTLFLFPRSSKNGSKE